MQLPAPAHESTCVKLATSSATKLKLNSEIHEHGCYWLLCSDRAVQLLDHMRLAIKRVGAAAKRDPSALIVLVDLPVKEDDDTLQRRYQQQHRAAIDTVAYRATVFASMHTRKTAPIPVIMIAPMECTETSTQI